MGVFGPANRVPHEVIMPIACGMKIAAARMDGPDGPPCVVIVLERHPKPGCPVEGEAMLETCLQIRSRTDLDDLIRVLRDCANVVGLR